MRNVIYDLEQKRIKLLKLFITSITLAFSINLIVSYLGNPNINNLWMLLTGSCIIFMITVVYGIIIFMNRVKTFVFTPVFILDDTKKMYRIHNYGISDDMVDAMHYAFKENKGLKKLLATNNIASPGDKKSETNYLLEELIEYCVLCKMSSITTDFYNGTKKNNTLALLDEDKLSLLTTKNRFIKLFSEPMKNRKAFNNNYDFIQNDEGTILKAYSQGAMYEKLELYLPKETKVRKVKPNTIMFDFRFFKLTIHVDFSGYGSYFPLDFLLYYVNLKDKLILDNCFYEARLHVTIKEKFYQMFSPVKKESYLWIDKFLDSLDDYLNFDKFLDKIHWDSIGAFLMVGKNKNKRNNIHKK